MKTLTIALLGLLAAAPASVLAHQDFGETGGTHWIEHLSQQATSPDTLAKERLSQKGSDCGKDNHEEGTGGHGLYEARKPGVLSQAQLEQQRRNIQTLDRDRDNHEEGTGGHGLYEAGKK